LIEKLSVDKIIFHFRVVLLKIDERDVSNKSEKMLALIQEFDRNIDNKSFMDSISKLPANISFQISLCENLVKYQATSRITSKRYKECFEEVIKGLSLNGEVKDADVVQHYQDAYGTNYKPFFEDQATLY